MKTAGVVFDFYDDLKGSLLKEAFPTPEALPELVKTAHILSPEERDVLRDEAFALVMSNEGKILRKFACVDAGNTLLSCLYFEENAQRLPEEAVKVAAVNLASFCQDFGFEPTNFVKMAAASQSRTRDSMRQPVVGDEADWAARTNLVSIRGGSDSGRVIPTANQMKTAGLAGMAQHVSHDLMKPHNLAMAGIAATGGLAMGKKKKPAPVAPSPAMPKQAGLLNVYVVRQNEVPHEVNLDSHHKLNPGTKPLDAAGKAKARAVGGKAKKAEVHGGGQTLTDDKKDNGPKSKNPDLLKKSGGPSDKNSFSVGQGKGDLEVNYKSIPKIATIVDVSGKTPVHKFEKKASKRFALGHFYPLDSYADVKAAVDYFNDYSGTLNPADRHEYAVKTAARADELGIETSELLSRYGSTEYAPDLDAHLASRKAAAPNFGAVYDAMREKRAEVSPDQFVELLQKVDEEAGLNWYYGGDVTDPYLATFGGKEKSANAAWSWEGPNGESLSAEQLKGLAGRESFTSSFSEDITSEFAKDPVAIFDSMPAPTKAIMARLALEE